jgi:nitroreductase
LSAEAFEQLMGVIRGRRSIRRFSDGSVTRDTLERLIAAASWAPSATNRQDWFFSVIQSPELKAELADIVRARWREVIESHKHLGSIEEIERYSAFFTGFEGSPVVVAVSASATGSLQREIAGDLAPSVAGSIASAAMAAQNLMLAAHALGLGTCCLTGPLIVATEIRGLLELGRKRELVCLIAVGYPDEAPEPSARRPLAEIVRWW